MLKSWKFHDLLNWVERRGGGGCNFSMSDNAPTFRLVFFYGLEPYPYVAKGSYVSLNDTPPLVLMVMPKKTYNIEDFRMDSQWLNSN